MRTSRFNRHFAPVQIEFPLTAIHYNTNTPQFRKADKFFGPFSTLTVHNSLDNADAHLPLMQVCPPQLTNSTTRIIIALVRIVLASGQPFSQAYSKGEH